MTSAQADIQATKRDLWLCFARAFAPPGGDSFHAAFVEDLPADLDAMADELKLRIEGELDSLRQALRNLEGALELQQLYAALFVTPPAPVLMNTAIYIDGAFLGRTEEDINTWFVRHGFGRAQGFRDLSDHAAVQLEFIGLLYEKASKCSAAGEDMDALAYATEAERFLAAYPKRWINPFMQAIEQACTKSGLNASYLHLARIIWHVLENELAHGAARFEVEAGSTFPGGSSRGMGALTGEDLAEIAFRLKAAGLSFDHVRQRPEWNEAAYEARCHEAVASYLAPTKGS